MWREVGLIGRDKLLEKEIYPAVKGKKGPFLISGPRGIGKTAVLEWAYEHAPGPKAFLTCTATVRENLIELARAWGLEIEGENGKTKSPLRATVAELSRAIAKAPDGRKIFVDDIQRATPSFLRHFKVWRERHVVFCAGVPPFKREELKRNLWGLREIHLEPIPRGERERLARKLCMALGATKSPKEISRYSRGYPGRMVALVKGIIEEESPGGHPSS